jgi:LSM domain
VLDEAVEEKADGNKVQIGMVVIRGNSVVMLEVRFVVAFAGMVLTILGAGEDWGMRLCMKSADSALQMWFILRSNGLFGVLGMTGKVVSTPPVGKSRDLQSKAEKQQATFGVVGFTSVGIYSRPDIHGKRFT